MLGRESKFSEEIENLIEIGEISKAKEAIAEFQMALDELTQSIYNYNTIILIMENKLNEAEEAILNGLKLWPHNFSLILNWARIFKIRKKYYDSVFLYNVSKLITEDSKRKIDIQNIINSIINENNLSYEHECIVCGSKVDSFLPWGGYFSEEYKKFNVIGSDVVNCSCPICSCLDRTRHLILFFNMLDIWNKYIIGKKVLHIAPEIHIQNKMYSLGLTEYVCGDLYPNPKLKDIEKMDITCINYPNEYFDFILCNHVLEHIPNDLTALNELFRVLKHGGRAVLQTPYSPLLTITFEDENINTDELRLEFYGQKDHIRVYGMDLFDRFTQVGFKLNLVKSSELFSYEAAKYYGFNNDENLMMVEKC